MNEPYYTEVIVWKGTEHRLNFFQIDAIPKDLTFKQCQAVPFTKDGNVVLLKHIDGYNSLPGGTVEDGEDYETALRREVLEESACTIDEFGVFGLFEDTNLTTGAIQYQLRYWAKVSLLDEPVNDPDGKALERLVVPYTDAAEVLGWGEKGEVLIDLAKTAAAV